MLIQWAMQSGCPPLLSAHMWCVASATPIQQSTCTLGSSTKFSDWMMTQVCAEPTLSCCYVYVQSTAERSLSTEKKRYYCADAMVWIALKTCLRSLSLLLAPFCPLPIVFYPPRLPHSPACASFDQYLPPHSTNHFTPLSHPSLSPPFARPPTRLKMLMRTTLIASAALAFVAMVAEAHSWADCVDWRFNDPAKPGMVSSLPQLDIH